MIHQVFDNIYKIELPIPFPLKTMNVYFIDEAPRTLVDAGIKTEASFDTLKKGLETIGYGLDSIERILITHGHIDHTVKLKNCPPSSVLQSIFIRRNMEGFGRSSTPLVI